MTEILFTQQKSPFRNSAKTSVLPTTLSLKSPVGFSSWQHCERVMESKYFRKCLTSLLNRVNFSLKRVNRQLYGTVVAVPKQNNFALNWLLCANGVLVDRPPKKKGQKSGLYQKPFQNNAQIPLQYPWKRALALKLMGSSKDYEKARIICC